MSGSTSKVNEVYSGSRHILQPSFVEICSEVSVYSCLQADSQTSGYHDDFGVHAEKTCFLASGERRVGGQGVPAAQHYFIIMLSN